MTDEPAAAPLARVQDELVRALLDGGLRERMRDDPQAAPGLAGVDAAKLSFYARGLLGKRMLEVRALLPLTAQALAGNFEPRFRAFARTYVPQGYARHREDALAFARTLEVPEARFERTALAATRAQPFFALRWFRGRCYWWLRPGRRAALRTGHVP